MGPRPWRPAKELEAALERGDLRFAVWLAEELRTERGKPISLELAARFLPLIAKESPREYDAWALRWLTRWASETGGATIEQAAEVAVSCSRDRVVRISIAGVRLDVAADSKNLGVALDESRVLVAPVALELISRHS
jgi:hypothetical protein